MSKPSLTEVIKLANDAALAGVHVALPGVIVTYDSTTHRAEVQLLLQERHVGDDGLEIKTLPVMSDVPVQFPGFGGNRITFPVRAGDGVLVIFTSRAIARWKAGAKGVHDPGDDRHHALPDAIIVAGCDPEPPVDASVAYVEIHSETTIRCGGDNRLVTLGEFLAHKHSEVKIGTEISGGPVRTDLGGFDGTSKLRG